MQPLNSSQTRYQTRLPRSCGVLANALSGWSRDPRNISHYRTQFSFGQRPLTGCQSAHLAMLWRAWRISHQIQGFERRLAHCRRPRHFATKPINLQSPASECQPSLIEPSIKEIANTEIDAPLYRAAQLFREPEAIPVRSKYEDIKISGNIRSIRKQKNASFAHISDGSTLAPIQAVLTPELAAGYVDIPTVTKLRF